VYQATHTLDIEKMGGLVKKMPQTTFLFLIAAIAISGLPPFNGFISEFILYTGLFSLISTTSIAPLAGLLLTITGLVLIGGLAVICFTKTFGVVFLGNPRVELHHEIKEPPFLQLLPLYLIASVIAMISLFPKFFMDLLIKPIQLFTGLHQLPFASFQGNGIEALLSISQAAWYFVLLILLIWGIKKLVMRKRISTVSPTWNCAYVRPTARIQYTGTSFVKSYSKLFAAFFLIFKKEKEVTGIFPVEAHLESRPYDKIEKWVIDYPTIQLKRFLGRFRFIQNGRVQSYVLYGIVFVLFIITLTVFNII